MKAMYIHIFFLALLSLVLCTGSPVQASNSGIYKNSLCSLFIKTYSDQLINDLRAFEQAGDSEFFNNGSEYLRRKIRVKWLEHTLVWSNNARVAAIELLEWYKQRLALNTDQLNKSSQNKADKKFAYFATDQELRARLKRPVDPNNSSDPHHSIINLELLEQLPTRREITGQGLEFLEKFMRLKTALLQMRYEFFLNLLVKTPLDKIIAQSSESDVVAAFKASVIKARLSDFEPLTKNIDLNPYIKLLKTSNLEISEAMANDPSVPDTIRDYIKEVQEFVSFLKKYPALSDMIRNYVELPFASSINMWRSIH